MVRRRGGGEGDDERCVIRAGVRVPPYRSLTFVDALDLVPLRFASLIERSGMWSDPVFGGGA